VVQWNRGKPEPIRACRRSGFFWQSLIGHIFVHHLFVSFASSLAGGELCGNMLGFAVVIGSASSRNRPCVLVVVVLDTFDDED
jgi:hypothetical protein